MPGRPWTRDEEETLIQMIQSGETTLAIADKLGKTDHAIYEKARRLGISVSVTKGTSTLTSTQISLPTELPTAEEALKMLAAALQEATHAGLNKVEVLRLQTLATIARTYDSLLANYIRYRQIEAKLNELEQKYVELIQESKNDAPESNSTQMAQPPTK